MNKSRVYSLDVLRVLCTLCVFFCHASFLLPATLNDYIGALTGFVLELFFILSGFVTMVAWKKPQRFFIKKVKKVWPLHFIMYIACFVLQYLYNPQVWSFSDSVKQTAVNLLFLQSWTPNETYVYSYNGVTWFLSSLFFCYLLTPMVEGLIQRKVKYAGFLLAAIISTRFIYVTCFNSFIGVGGFCYTNIFPPYRFLEYALGMVLGALYKKADERLTNSAVQLFGVACFGIVFVLLKWNGEIWNFSKMLIVFELFMLYSISFYEGILDCVAKWKPIQYINKFSLHIFLVHQVVIKYARYFASRVSVDLTKHSTINLILLLSITLLLCSLYEKCVSRISKK